MNCLKCKFVEEKVLVWNFLLKIWWELNIFLKGHVLAAWLNSSFPLHCNFTDEKSNICQDSFIFLFLKFTSDNSDRSNFFVFFIIFSLVTILFITVKSGENLLYATLGCLFKKSNFFVFFSCWLFIFCTSTDEKGSERKMTLCKKFD